MNDERMDGPKDRHRHASYGTDSERDTTFLWDRSRRRRTRALAIAKFNKASSDASKLNNHRLPSHSDQIESLFILPEECAMYIMVLAVPCDDGG